MRQDRNSSAHFVGIGGIGLSGLARLLRSWGWEVSGSDREASPLTTRLAQGGITVHIGHDARHVGDAELVVVSSAIAADNPELVAAKQQGRTVIKRDELLSQVTHGKRCVAIAGTHGKTTTTAMTGLCLEEAGLDPLVLVGGIVREWDSNIRLSRSDLVVVEADEYDHAFLGLRPDAAVVTTIEMDHPDIFANMADVTEAFGRFLEQVQPGGVIIAHTPDAALEDALQTRAPNVTVWRYGLEEAGDWTATDIAGNAQGGNDFSVRFRGQDMGRFALPVPGKHNVSNALAAIAVTRWVGQRHGIAQAATEAARTALESFRGVDRRMQRLGIAREILVVDDYAHHPTEVQATLSALRDQSPDRPVWAIFQPHTFSRTKALLDQFASCFGQADHVLVTDIYAAREVSNGTVDAQSLVAKMDHPDARYVGSLDRALAYALQYARPGDTVITLGAGNVTTLGPRLLKALGFSREINLPERYHEAC